mmetsp:Transcript_93017/g.266713  ORF Transcript_93017/g.266713 Transcript_93017/m.266713 type:complete len:226 (-) Transcript_93017:361-1038(-)
MQCAPGHPHFCPHLEVRRHMLISNVPRPPGSRAALPSCQHPHRHLRRRRRRRRHGRQPQAHGGPQARAPPTSLAVAPESGPAQTNSGARDLPPPAHASKPWRQTPPRVHVTSRGRHHSRREPTNRRHTTRGPLHCHHCPMKRAIAHRRAMPCLCKWGPRKGRQQLRRPVVRPQTVSMEEVLARKGTKTRTRPRHRRQQLTSHPRTRYQSNILFWSSRCAAQKNAA